MTKKEYLYHVTEKDNLKSILRDGLKRKGFAVYLSENPLSWWKPGLIILKVKVTGLNDKMTKVDENLDEILIWDNIEPERISEYKLSKEQRLRAEKQYMNNRKENNYE